MIDVILLPLAKEELREAASFLERRVPGLGDRLTVEVVHALARLAENPRIGPPLRGGLRKLVVKRFPYNLIYRLASDHVVVVAVAHHRRHPEYWRDRT